MRSRSSATSISAGLLKHRRILRDLSGNLSVLEGVVDTTVRRHPFARLHVEPKDGPASRACSPLHLQSHAPAAAVGCLSCPSSIVRLLAAASLQRHVFFSSFGRQAANSLTVSLSFCCAERLVVKRELWIPFIEEPDIRRTQDDPSGDTRRMNAVFRSMNSSNISERIRSRKTLSTGKRMRTLRGRATRRGIPSWNNLLPVPNRLNRSRNVAGASRAMRIHRSG